MNPLRKSLGISRLVAPLADFRGRALAAFGASAAHAALEGAGAALLLPALYALGAGEGGATPGASLPFAAKPATLLALAAGTLALKAPAGYLAATLSAGLRDRAWVRMRERMLERFQSMTYEEFLGRDPSELLHLLQHRAEGLLLSLNALYGLASATLLLAAYGAAGGLWAAWLARCRAATVAPAASPLGLTGDYALAAGGVALLCALVGAGAALAAAGAAVNRRVRRHGAGLSAAEERLQRLILDEIEGKAVIHSLDLAAPRAQLHAAAARDYLRESTAVQAWRSAGRPGLELVAAGALAIGALVAAGAGDALSARGAGLATAMPAVAAAFFLLYRMGGWIGAVHGALAELAQRRRDTEAVLDFLEARTPQRPPGHAKDSCPPTETNPALDARELSYRYTPARPSALRDVSLRIRAGELVAVVGRSGSGKTTLSQLAGGMLSPGGGQILLDGEPLAALDRSDLASRIGVAFERPFLFNETLGWNIRCGRALDEAAVREAARAAGLLEFVESLPLGFETPVGFHGIALSNGQRQRLALARAVAGRPRLLVLDEATSAVDPATERAIGDFLRSYRERGAVLMVTHRLATARDADRIVVLEDGHLAGVGTHGELRNGCAAYRALLAQSD